MSKRVTHVHLAGAATALALMSFPASAQQSGGNSAASSARRDSCYTAVTGDTAKYSAMVAKATAGGMSLTDANRSMMAKMDSTKRRAMMACVRSKSATSGGEVSLNKRAESETRIPVSKEVVVIAPPPEPPPPPPPAPEPPPPPPPPAPEPKYTPVPAPMIVKHYGNWYVGLGAGASIPVSRFDQAYDAGFAMQLPIGWESPNSIVGGRLNFGYQRFQGRSTFRSTGTIVPIGTGNSTTTIVNGQTVVIVPRLALEDSRIWSGMADLTLRIPWTGQWGGPMNGLYLVGGGGFNTFVDWSTSIARTNPDVIVGNNNNNVIVGPNNTIVTDGNFDLANNKTETRFAANAGGGFSVGLGIADVFAESRYVWAFTPNNHLGYVPIILGVALRY